MNLFHLLGTDASSNYSEVSKTSVTNYALVLPGMQFPDIDEYKYVHFIAGSFATNKQYSEISNTSPAKYALVSEFTPPTITFIPIVMFF